MRQLAEIEMEKARQDASRTHPARVMSFSMGAVQIGEFPNPEQIERGFDVAEKEIHLQKERYVSKVVDIAAPVAIAPYEALSSVSLRAAEATMLSSITQAEDLAAGLTSEDEVPPQSRTERFAKNSLKWQAGGFDPSLGDSVVRYNLRRNVPFRALFNPKEAQSVSAFILDVNHFGVLNNQLGYPRADALISRLAKMVQQEFPEALIVRKDGGKLVVITQGGCSEESLQVLRHRAELALKECVNDRVIAEYQMRVALDLWDTGKRGTHLIETGIRRVKLSQSVVSPDDSATLGEVMEQLEGAAQLRRHPRPKEIGSRRRVA
jgi:GGDEF domain-containing protein